MIDSKDSSESYTEQWCDSVTVSNALIVPQKYKARLTFIGSKDKLMRRTVSASVCNM